MNEASKKLLRWAFFGVLVALAPLLCSFFDLVMKGKAATIGAIIGDGGLLLILSAISAGALGELIGSGSTGGIYKIISGGCVLLVLILSTVLFASILEEKTLRADMRGSVAGYDESSVAHTSIWIFLIGVVPCAVCIAISEL